MQTATIGYKIRDREREKKTLPHTHTQQHQQQKKKKAIEHRGFSASIRSVILFSISLRYSVVFFFFFFVVTQRSQTFSFLFFLLWLLNRACKDTFFFLFSFPALLNASKGVTQKKGHFWKTEKMLSLQHTYVTPPWPWDSVRFLKLQEWEHYFSSDFYLQVLSSSFFFRLFILTSLFFLFQLVFLCGFFYINNFFLRFFFFFLSVSLLRGGWRQEAIFSLILTLLKQIYDQTTGKNWLCTVCQICCWHHSLLACWVRLLHLPI